MASSSGNYVDTMLETWFTMTMTTNRTYTLGQTITLPDGPTGKLVRIEDGIEYGEPAIYLTVISSLGNEVTRWVR